MKQLAALAVVVFLLARGLDARSDETFAPRGGQFEVEFPGTPRASTTTAKSPVGKLQVYTATYADARGNVFMVSYTNFPEGTGTGENRATVLEGARKGLKGKDRTVLSETEIKVGKDEVPGAELVLQSDKQRMRVRLVLRGDRLFQVGVIGTKDFVEGKSATEFLKSFELTK